MGRQLKHNVRTPTVLIPGEYFIFEDDSHHSQAPPTTKDPTMANMKCVIFIIVSVLFLLLPWVYQSFECLDIFNKVW